jgi:hypothetical protein
VIVGKILESKLVVSASEADTVRHIFRRYAELGSVSALQLELDRDPSRQASRYPRNSPKLGSLQHLPPIFVRLATCAALDLDPSGVLPPAVGSMAKPRHDALWPLGIWRLIRFSDDIQYILQVPSR